MGKGGGAFATWKCCKVFCASAVTVKRSADQLFMHYFHILWRVGVVHLVFLVCVLRATTKKGPQLFRGKKCTPEKILATPMNLATHGKNPSDAHGS